MNQKSIFERFLEAMQKTGDYMLAWEFQKKMMKDQLLRDEELDRIAEKVLSHIHIQLEDDALKQLAEMLNNLRR